MLEHHPKAKGAHINYDFLILSLPCWKLVELIKLVSGILLPHTQSLDWYSGEGNGTPLQCSCLGNPTDRGAWWAAGHGVAKSRTRLSDFTFTFHFHALEKEMATHSNVLAWRIPGMAEPGWAAVYGASQSQTWLKWLSSKRWKRGIFKPMFLSPCQLKCIQ